MWFRTLFNSLKPGHSCPSPQQARYGGARRRPTSVGLFIEALEDRSVPASLSVGNATILEGNAGTQNAAVVVSLSTPSGQTVTVNYSTAGRTALAGSDYLAVSGKLTFAPGQTSKTILVPVIGDRVAELDETFVVKLQGAKNATIANGRGTVTVAEDEPRISIGDVSQPEGNSGTTLFTFTVSLSAAYDQAVTVNYATADGTATAANNDYVAAFGTLTFAPGETTKTITVEVVGNTTPEPDKTIYINLSGASTNALVARGQGVGTIMDDDGWIPEPPPVDSGLPAIPTEGYYDPSNPYGIAP
jgi:hypothetical protein